MSSLFELARRRQRRRRLAIGVVLLLVGAAAAASIGFLQRDGKTTTTRVRSSAPNLVVVRAVPMGRALHLRRLAVGTLVTRVELATAPRRVRVDPRTGVVHLITITTPNR